MSEFESESECYWNPTILGKSNRFTDTRGIWTYSLLLKALTNKNVKKIVFTLLVKTDGITRL